MPRSRSTTVTASPAAAVETAICTVANMSVPVGDTIDFDFAADLTIGTAGVSVVFKMRRGGDATGATILTTSAITVVAGNHYLLCYNAQDTQPGEYQNQSYTLTATVGSASAQTTVNGVYLGAVW